MLILVPQPVTDSVRRNLLISHAQGAHLVHAGGNSGAVLAAFRHWSGHIVGDRGTAPYLIVPGASSARGCLGYVSAAFELAEQIKTGEVPQPDDIFVPVGSNGTIAGLEVGLRLAGLPIRVVGVRVSDRLPPPAPGRFLGLPTAAGRCSVDMGVECPEARFTREILPCGTDTWGVAMDTQPKVQTGRSNLC